MLTQSMALLTGGTGGIGYEVALGLLAHGVDIFIIGRNPDKGTTLCRELQTRYPQRNIIYAAYDLSLMSQVEALANHVQSRMSRLDMLIHCSGVMLRRRTLTTEGLETVFAVQYLARFWLTLRLLPILDASSNPQVLNVSSGGSIKMDLDFDNLNGEKHYSGVHALQHESIANDLLMLALAERYPKLKSYNYGPGYVRTTLLQDMDPLLRGFSATFGRLIAITPQQAAQDILELLQNDHPSGLYGRRLRFNAPTGFKAQPHHRQRLWELSQTMVNAALKTKTIHE